MILALILAAVPAQGQTTTADLSFMVGEWDLEGSFHPGSPQEVKETGTRTCGFVLNDSYVHCEWTMTNAKGRVRQLVSYHNYNRLYGRFEHLFVASNWPTKVIGTSNLTKSGAGQSMAIDIRFALPDGRAEHVRSVETYSGDRFTTDEQIRIGADGGWQTNTRFVGVRKR